jgi:hypothetical protein
MATKPIVFKPTLNTPQGINNYTGEVFRCFTKGDTLPFKFVFFTDAAEVVDVTGWTVSIVMSTQQAADNCRDDAAVVIDVDIPLTDLATATFEGDVTDSETQSLPAGLVYVMAKYTTLAGATHIMDMGLLEVYPNLTAI